MNAIALDITRFYVQSEQVRGEPRYYWVVDRTKTTRYNSGAVTDMTTSKRVAFYQCASLNGKEIIGQEEQL